MFLFNDIKKTIWTTRRFFLPSHTPFVRIWRRIAIRVRVVDAKLFKRIWLEWFKTKDVKNFDKGRVCCLLSVDVEPGNPRLSLLSFPTVIELYTLFTMYSNQALYDTSLSRHQARPSIDFSTLFQRLEWIGPSPITTPKFQILSAFYSRWRSFIFFIVDIVREWSRDMIRRLGWHCQFYASIRGGRLPSEFVFVLLFVLLLVVLLVVLYC